MTVPIPHSPPVTFKPETALAYARDLSRPRLVGTPGEAAAIDAISHRLAQAGCQVSRQPFVFSTGAQVATTLQVLLAQILILLTFWAWGLSALAGLVPAALLLALLGVTGRVHRLVAAASIVPPEDQPVSRWQRLCLRLGERCATENVVARAPIAAGAGDSPRPHVFFVAHSDSKSQALPLVVRMLLIVLAGLAAAAFAALTMLRPIWPALTSPAALLGVFALLAGVPVLFLFLAGAGNASPGAIDNASGTGLLLHLAEVLAADPPTLDVTFLVTGAEELGVVGATAYVLAHGAELARRQAEGSGVYVLNFDGIGSEGRLALVGGGKSSRLGALVRACCVELQLPLGRLPLVGALFDHIPFAESGFEALSLVTLGAAGRAVHTPADSPDKLHVEGFRQSGEVALAVLKKVTGDW